MSGIETVDDPIDELPTFALEYGVDDPDDPDEVTIFAPDAESITTSWISIDAGHALPIGEIA